MGIGSGNNFQTTTGMGLRLPTPGQCGGLGFEPAGLSWMELLNSSLSSVDQHTHAPGFGSQIPSAGLNINADVAWGSNNLTGLRSARFSAISLGSLASADKGCLIVSGVDLYYVDTLGNHVQITASGGVAGTPGSIGSLTSPALATYTAASKLFSFTSSSGFAAGISGGPLVLTDSSLSSGKAATIAVPAGLASNYNLTLPGALPASDGLMVLSTTGVMSVFGAVSGTALTLPGQLNVGGAISNVTDPTVGSQAATKNYVDTNANPAVFSWGCETLSANSVLVGDGGQMPVGYYPGDPGPNVDNKMVARNAWVAPIAGVLRNLRVSLGAAWSSGTSVTFTVYTSAAGTGAITASTLTVTVTAQVAGTYADITHSVTLAAGDQVFVRQASHVGGILGSGTQLAISATFSKS